MNVNEKITSYRVVLIDSNGVNKGEFLKSAAILQARQDGLDLVEVSVAPNGIPVCRVMDFGKAQYDKQKQDRHQKHAPSPKAVRFKYKTDPHDVETKRKQINEFLAKGHRVTLNMMLAKGREMTLFRGEAKEKFFQIVSSFSSTAVLSDIKEHAKGYNFTLAPGTK